MSNTATTNRYEEHQKSDSEWRDSTAYSLVGEINDDLDFYGLEPGMVSLDVEIESSEELLEVEYEIETLGWYEDDGELGLGREPVSFNNTYSLETDIEIPEDEVANILEDNFNDSAIRANSEVIQEAPSPDYDAF